MEMSMDGKETTNNPSQLPSNSNGTLIIHHVNTLYTINFQDPNFHATKLDFPENLNFLQTKIFRLVGSYNGVLCIQFCDKIALYNPTTQAHKIMPQTNPKEKASGKLGKPRHAFGYDCVSNDYKILRFEKNNQETLLYSLSTNSWEIIEKPYWSYQSVQFPGVVANNTIYWMEVSHLNIKCFDLNTRRFYEMPIPEQIRPHYFPKLAVLGGTLYLVTYYLHIWKLENFEEQGFNWTRVFRCSSSEWNNIYKLTGCFSWRSGFCLACSEDGRKILVARFGGPLNFICFDIESQETSIVREVPGLSSTWKNYSCMLPWEGSRVPIEA